MTDGNGALVIPKWFLVFTTVVLIPTLGGVAVWGYQMEKEVSGIREDLAGQRTTLNDSAKRIDRMEGQISGVREDVSAQRTALEFYIDRLKQIE